MEKDIKNGFRDPLAIKAPKRKSYQGDFKAPSYDELRKGYGCAGNDYGVGHKQPVGKLKEGNSDVIPQTGRAFSAER